MSQQEKAAYFRALRDSGVKFDKHYREYNTAELKAAYEKLTGSSDLPVEPDPVPTGPTTPGEDAPPADMFEQMERQRQALLGDLPAEPEPPRPAPQLPVTAADPAELPGQRQNSKAADEPIRVDENGLIWFQEEVLKPAYPKPRGRRVLDYMESGAKVETVKNGDYVESFEVAGDEHKRPAQVKITLPSYQVGIYKDPRFPFKIHTYNGNRGFDLFEVQNYYGGSELVPAECKRVYIENDLCYDIRSVVRAIQTEFRQLQLAGKVQ